MNETEVNGIKVYTPAETGLKGWNIYQVNHTCIRKSLYLREKLIRKKEIHNRLEHYFNDSLNSTTKIYFI